MKHTRLFLGVLTITAALAIQVHARPFLSNGVMGFYPFNGNANDASTNGNNGVVNGATLTTDRFASSNRAYRFNGAGWIQLPDALTPVAASELTLSVWVLADGGPYTTQEKIIHLTPRIGECGLDLENGSWGFLVKLKNSQTYGIANPMITNAWTHLVGVWKQGQYIELWVNGSLVQSNAVPNYALYTQSFPLNSAMGIYDYTGGPYWGFQGAIDDVRVYNRALSASEVQQLYQYESRPPSDIPHAATTAATVVNGFAAPAVLIQGGGGTDAKATVSMSNGVVTGITITDAGAGYTSTPTINFNSPIAIQVGLQKAVRPSFRNLSPGFSYQLQVSRDLNTWTNQGSPFTATSPTMIFSQYWDVDNWNQLFFRLQVSP
jgi:hypothetical protein